MRSNTRSSSRRRFRISDEARPSVENIVKSFMGMTVAPGERAKNSTTASWAMAMEATQSRSRNDVSSGSGPYFSSGTDAVTSHSRSASSTGAGRSAPGSPGGTVAARGFRALRTMQ
jgi:hypothetical protein